MAYMVANLDRLIHPADDRMREIFSQVGAEVISKDCATEEEIIEFAQEADLIIAPKAPVTGKVIEHLKKCKLILRPGVGTDNVDHEAATTHGIVVIYWPIFCVEEVSNHIISLLFALHKKLFKLDKYVRNGRWGVELSAPLTALNKQTLGLIGFGRIGQAVARKISAFGLKITAYDPYVDEDIFDEFGVEAKPLEELIRQADFISLNTPLTDATRNLIGEKEFAIMKRSVYIINCSRGAVVDEDALAEALAENRIAGAGLDCLSIEPPEKNSKLLKLDNVILTPHSAAYSDEAIESLRENSFIDAADALTGLRPRFIRNPEVLKKVKFKDRS